MKVQNWPYPFLHGQPLNCCKGRREKTEVPDPLAVEDLISCKLNNKRKLARLITQYVMVIGLSGVQFGL